MNNFDLIPTIPIILLYPFIFSKLGDVITGINKKRDIFNNTPFTVPCTADTSGKYPQTCYRRGKTIYTENIKEENAEELIMKNPEYSKIQKEYKDTLEVAETTKYIILIIAGLVGIFAAYYFKDMHAKLGVGVGGILTIFYATYVYWNKLNEEMKLALAIVAIILLININNIIKYYI